MPYRYIAIALIMLLLLVGAVHYPPLWFFVLIVPVWLDLAFTWEEERIRAETVQHFQDMPYAEYDDREDG